jgi:hypothetical protein
VVKRRLHCRYLTALGLVFLNAPLCAQSTAGIFPTLDASWQLNEKQSVSTYQFYALPLASLDGEYAKIPQWLLYYGEYSVNQNIGKNLSCSGAYVFQLENAGSSTVAKENRAHIQLKYSSTLGKTSLTGRVRSDNRFIKMPELSAANYAHRVRLLGGVSIPFNKWTLIAYEELFFNTPTLGEWRYAENWAAIQLKRQLANHLHLEAGPLYITWKLPTGRWYNQYYLQTTLNLSF